MGAELEEDLIDDTGLGCYIRKTTTLDSGVLLYSQLESLFYCSILRCAVSATASLIETDRAKTDAGDASTRSRVGQNIPETQALSYENRKPDQQYMAIQRNRRCDSRSRRMEGARETFVEQDRDDRGGWRVGHCHG